MLVRAFALISLGFAVCATPVRAQAQQENTFFVVNGMFGGDFGGDLAKGYPLYGGGAGVKVDRWTIEGNVAIGRVKHDVQNEMYSVSGTERVTDFTAAASWDWMSAGPIRMIRPGVALGTQQRVFLSGSPRYTGLMQFYMDFVVVHRRIADRTLGLAASAGLTRVSGLVHPRIVALGKFEF
jgi:hypothetical protein